MTEARGLTGSRLLRAVYRRALVANVVGATIAFVYLSFGAPPQPAPPHDEQFLYLAVVPVYFAVAAVVGYASAPELVATLNRLFERIVPIVHAHGGHVDKYVGDGLLAVFGAPRRQEDHADQALAASQEIAAAVAEEFQGRLSIGIGLNSGPVVAGNVGGAARLEFSVIGDAVKVAARVEAATRETRDTVLVSEPTRALLSDGAADALEQRPALPLRGKTRPVQLFAPKVAARHRAPQPDGRPLQGHESVTGTPARTPDGEGSQSASGRAAARRLRP
jgi:class 3 adenylate cyclase